MKNLIFLTALWALAALPAALPGQSIRKDYREFTAKERQDYKTAVQQLAQNYIILDFTTTYYQNICANIHATSGATCHPAQYGEYFLPWHRVLLQDFEYQLKNWTGANAYLAVPYWDWTVDNNPGAPGFWDQPNFLDEANFIPDLSITRCLGTGSCAGANLPATSDVATLLGLTSFYQPGVGPPSLTATDFTHYAGALNDKVNVWVGPTQDNKLTAPDDPAFFLHLAMIDKLWQQWEDDVVGTQSGLPHGSIPMASTSSGSQNVIADQVYDSRHIPLSPTGGRPNDVWYASQGKVILDGADGNDFVATDLTAPYLYRYTTVKPTGTTVGGGEIYVGDVQRDVSNNVIADTKGGFVVNAGVTCDFRAGRAIVFLPGYQATLGASSVAKIITIPDGLAPGDPSGEVSERAANSTKNLTSNLTAPVFKCFPNPVVDRATFEYTLAAPAQVSLQILDMTGKTISTFSPGEQAEGTHQFDWATGALPKGLYFCHLQAGSQTQTLKVVVN